MAKQCVQCLSIAETNDDKFYYIRTTRSGKDFDAELSDKLLCLACLEDYIFENGCQHIQSIIRIENPKPGDI